ncbi:dTDP-4-dehydrorhamnose 3,5-epimerase [Prochlorococcus sp. AH-716-D22]|nr:dTDP-4-dehydrorhamnose 3,5-epimerase [Prochlorococcus sp. AH-716-D22]
MEKIIITNLSKIPTEGGDIFHCLKNSENSFYGFGEAYFSNINFSKIKAWKRHMKMTCNLVVPYGKVKFVFYDEDNDRKSTFVIGKDNYCRITVLPKIWFGFEGLHYPSSLILNISDIPHSPNEIERKEIDASNFYWSTL